MELQDLKSKLDSGETVYFRKPDEHIAFASKSSLTNMYIFMFNAKVLFGYKTFSVFKKKLEAKIKQHSLEETTEDC